MRKVNSIPKISTDREEPGNRRFSEDLSQVIGPAEGPAVPITSVVVENRSSELLQRWPIKKGSYYLTYKAS